MVYDKIVLTRKASSALWDAPTSKLLDWRLVSLFDIEVSFSEAENASLYASRRDKVGDQLVTLTPKQGVIVEDCEEALEELPVASKLLTISYPLAGSRGYEYLVIHQGELGMWVQWAEEE